MRRTNSLFGQTIAILVLAASWAAGAENGLSNRWLSLEFSRQDARFAVTELRTRLTYRQYWSWNWNETRHNGCKRIRISRRGFRGHNTIFVDGKD